MGLSLRKATKGNCGSKASCRYWHFLPPPRKHLLIEEQIEDLLVLRLWMLGDYQTRWNENLMDDRIYACGNDEPWKEVMRWLYTSM